MNTMSLLPTPRGRWLTRLKGCRPSMLPTHVRKTVLAMTTVALMVAGRGAMAQAAAPGKAVSAAEIMYLVLVGEMQVAAQEPGIGFSLLLEAARKSSDQDVYRRAVNVALASHSGEAAKEAARAWANVHPLSADPYRVLLQVMLAGNEVAQSAAPLGKLLAVVPDAERNALIEAVGQTYARAQDKAAARQVATAALQPWTQRADTAASAWAAQGILALSLGQNEQALALLREATTSPPGSGAVGVLAIELLKAKVREAEGLLGAYLLNTPNAPLSIRMAYVRFLLDSDRASDAQRELEAAVAQEPDAAEPWLLLGALNVQKKRLDTAEEQLRRFLALSGNMAPEQARRGSTQAYLSLSQIAQQRQQFEAAAAWLDRIDATDDTLPLQVRRATLLAQQGKVNAARALIQQIPAPQATDVRAKLLAEVQLLKDAQQWKEAFTVIGEAADRFPDDEELAYEHAMLADKVGQPDEMERILRALMARRPDYHHAYNALGYALADRNTRLHEAKALIEKALEAAPGDPFITDSLGWVEFRLGNFSLAAQLLRKAYEKQPDIEIAVHLGEVLWAMGEPEAAKTAFQQAQDMQADHPLLLDTLKRLGVSL